MAGNSFFAPARIVAAIIVLALPGWAATDAGAFPAKKKFTVGIWFGNAFHNNKTKKFSHCGIAAHYGNGITMVMTITRKYGLAIGFLKDGWRLREGDSYEVSVDIDNRLSETLSATTVKDYGIRVGFKRTRTWYRALRKGRNLTLRAAQGEFDFKLKDTSIALARAADCVDEALALEKKAIGPNPFQARSSDQEPRNAKQQTARRVEPPRAQERENILTQADMLTIITASGLDGYELLGKTDRRKRFPSATHVWLSKKVIGLVFQPRRKKSRTVDGLSASVIEDINRRCKGTFGSGSRRSRQLGDFQTKRMFAKCESERNSAVYYITVIFSKSRTATAFLHLGDPADRQEVAAADEKIARYLVNTFGK